MHICLMYFIIYYEMTNDIQMYMVCHISPIGSNQVSSRIICQAKKIWLFPISEITPNLRDSSKAPFCLKKDSVSVVRDVNIW